MGSMRFALSAKDELQSSSHNMRFSAHRFSPALPAFDSVQSTDPAPWAATLEAFLGVLTSEVPVCWKREPAKVRGHSVFL